MGSRPSMQREDRRIPRIRGTGHTQQLWPVLALLSVAVLVPTLCVLWFMSQAVSNERLAVKQRLVDVYREQLEGFRNHLQADWREGLAGLPEFDPRANPAVVFESVVHSGRFDSVILRDPQGNVLYPASPVVRQVPEPDDLEEDEPWIIARQFEADDSTLEAAAGVYAQIARDAGTPALAAQALQAQVRCLLRAGYRGEAVKISCDTLLEEPYWNMLDEQGRSIAANGALLALQIIPEPASAEYVRVRDRLGRFVNDYEHVTLSSAQRIFLMEELRRIAVPAVETPTLAAEQLACAFLDQQAENSPGPAPDASTEAVLARSPLPGIWAVATRDGTATALVGEDHLESRAGALLAEYGPLANASVRLVPADRLRHASLPFLNIPAGNLLADWELALTLDGPNPFDAAASRRITAYLWIGILVILATTIIAGVLGRHVGRQVKLTRLKNDLIATVSHELKTPLSSIRALVDTLLARRNEDPKQTREYLELIARENVRLSRLIDNFLTFSRMERNRHAFTLTPCRPARIVEAARDSMGDRLEAAGCSFTVEVPADLPEITADHDAMVTVLLNLLDNACKYSHDEKRVGLRVYPRGDEICFEVSDNGIGLSRRATRRIFDRFYQVDQTLSRRAGGCGLGLSIVDFIVKAHGGSIGVRSQPGKGSTFTVRIPAEQTARTGIPEAGAAI